MRTGQSNETRVSAYRPKCLLKQFEIKGKSLCGMNICFKKNLRLLVIFK